MNTLFTRRSVREYSDLPVENEKVTQLLKAGMQAPSGMNQQPWEFIVINEEKLLNHVKASIDKKSLQTAQVILVLIAKLDVRAPQYIDQDMGACTENILLEAVNQGLAACWTSVGKKEITDFIIDEFEVPANKRVFALISLGYPLTQEANRFVDRFDESRIQYNK